ERRSGQGLPRFPAHARGRCRDQGEGHDPRLNGGRAPCGLRVKVAGCANCPMTSWGGVMRIAIAVVLAFVLAGCVANPQPIVTAASGPAQGPTAWNIRKNTDRISGKPAASAFVVSVRTSYSKRDGRPAGVELSCFEHRPVVRVQFMARVGADRSAIL